MKFHWFLPTNGGDGRHVVSGGHGVDHGAVRPTRQRALPRPDRAQCRAARLRGGADAHRRLVRGRLAVHRDAQPRSPSGSSSSSPSAPVSRRRPSPRRWPRPSRTSPAAGCCSTSSPAARPTSSVPTATSSTRTRATRAATSSWTIVRRLWAGETVTFAGRAPPGRERQAPAAARPGARRSTSAAPRRRRETSRPSTPTSTSPGASRPPRSRRRSTGSAAWPRSRAASCRSASASTRSPATPPRRPGPRPTACCRASTTTTIAQRPGRPAAHGVGRPEARCSPSTRGRSDGLEIHPNLWAGVGLVRGGAGTALVGSHEEVADLIEEYAALGIDEFVLSAYPHLEGAYHFGEGVLPVLEKRGVWTNPAPAARPTRRCPSAPSGPRQ